MIQKRNSHYVALEHIDRLIQYKEEDDATLCDTMLLKKLQSQKKKRYFDTIKKATNTIGF